MKTKRMGVVFLVLLCKWVMPLMAGVPELVSATYLGTAGHDDLQDVAVADDGTIYVVGNLDQPLADLPGGVKAVALGQPVGGTWYRCGLLAQFNADGTELLRCVQFARGLAFLTSVALDKDRIYVGGYGTEKLTGLLGPLGGIYADFRQANAAPLPDPRTNPPSRSREIAWAAWSPTRPFARWRLMGRAICSSRASATAATPCCGGTRETTANPRRT